MFSVKVHEVFVNGGHHVDRGSVSELYCVFALCEYISYEKCGRDFTKM